MKSSKNGKWKSWFGYLVPIVFVVGLIGWVATADPSEPLENSEPVVKSELLSVVSDDWTKGPSDAPVTLVEYLDFECEACGAYYPVVKQLEEKYKDDLLVVNRYFPLPGHKNGMNAALAVEAAGLQGKYWEMHDILFENQETWGEQSVSKPSSLETYAEQIGLDMEQFRTDRNSDTVKERVTRDKDSGEALGVTGTPSFFLNGQRISNPKTLEDFETLIKAAITTSAAVVQAEAKDVHEHANLSIVMNGETLDLSQDKYQSTEDNPLDADAHLHDGNGSVVHKHRTGITLAYFLQTIGIRADSGCLTLDTEKPDEKSFCSEDGQTVLRLFVNGEAKETLADYEYQDLDQMLLVFGPEGEDITEYLSAIPDDACIYSQLCPERGTPPEESCVTGLGGGC